MNLGNVFKIFNKEMLHNMRETKGNVMMILFPIILIVILGMALSPVFGTQTEIGEVKVLYTKAEDSEISAGFERFMEYAGKVGMKFEETDDIEAGVASVKQATYSCYVLLKDHPQEIILYKNNRYYFEANLVETMLRTFVEKFNVISAVASENPVMLEKALEEPKTGFTDVKLLNRERQPGSLDYYSVTMLTMILLYSSMTGYWSVKNEQNCKTGNRMLCSPINMREILAGKTLGSITVTIIQAFLVLAFSRFVLNAYWGDNIWPVIAVIVSEAIMAVSIGIGVAFAIRNEAASSAVLNTVIPVMVFFGGGYVPFEILGKALQKISVISPVRWTNRAIFSAIYSNDYSIVPVAVMINLGIAVLFIVASSLVYRKEAV